jgi:hypothetical protein
MSEQVTGGDTAEAETPLRLRCSSPEADDYIERPLDELIAEGKLAFYVDGKFRYSFTPTYPATEYVHEQWEDGSTRYWVRRAPVMEADSVGS